MATVVLAAAGAAAGGAIGGSVLGMSSAVVGRAIGATIGRRIDERLLGSGCGPFDRVICDGMARNSLGLGGRGLEAIIG